jgi:hypothetical protein
MKSPPSFSEAESSLTTESYLPSARPTPLAEPKANGEATLGCDLVPEEPSDIQLLHNLSHDPI